MTNATHSRNNIANTRRAEQAARRDVWAGRPCVPPTYLNAWDAVAYRHAYEAAARAA